MSDECHYDSTLDTMKHSRRVDSLLLDVIGALQERVTRHDLSKMEDPEKAVFDRVTPQLKGSTYGSDEYKGFLAEMGEGLAHHYATNRHHPEHFKAGIDGMTLVDLIEMLVDWKAATERHDDGSLARSLTIQAERFSISPQLLAILTRTAEAFGWVNRELVQCKVTAAGVNYPCDEQCDPACAPGCTDTPTTAAEWGRPVALPSRST